MAYSIFLLNIIAVVTLCTLELEGNIHYEVGNNTDMEAALLLYQNYEKRHEKMMNKLIISIWNYKTNLTDYNKREYNKMNEEIKAFHDETRKNATSFAWENLEDIDVAALNWFLYMSKKPDEKVVENAAKLKKVITEMEEIYGKAKVCSYLSTFLQPCTLELDPDISEIMKESRNYQELKHFWTQWRDETGRKMRGDYLRYIDLNNENGYSNTQFEVDEDYFLMWETLKPLYRELHAYVRRKLIGKYSESYIKPNGPIPAHLLGNLWAYSWGNIFDLVIPYPNKKSVDVTKAMREKNITPLDMFKIAEKFFISIGLMPMPAEFWNRSIIKKPLDREMVCHPTAWYFYDGNDVRIKMCTTVDMDNLAIVHHEMGHIEYYLHVQDLPLYQRHGAHPGKNITPLDMFKIAEKFFTSIGLKPMPPEFWNKSIIEKPLNREMVCHPSAWYFFDGNDVRIKMCTSVDMDNLATVHHEMGHIEYYLHVQDLSLYQRHGAHPAFHEAVGDLIALSVTTTDYLERIGLLEEATDDPETEINILLYMALEKIAFQPHGLIVDLWRSNIFNGSTDKSELNKAWWKLRLDYQGVCPPVLRSEDDFDAGALYHVGADITYLRYFASIIVQFQFHQALCEEAGHKGPLHKCSIYKNKKAGKLLSDMLKLGSSVPWTEAMKLITKGKTDKMDSASILEYFQPLYAWLKKQNRNEFVGWNTSGDPMKCP
nr:angiotensin-converting enzyme [Parasteatoda tepidariorum]